MRSWKYFYWGLKRDCYHQRDKMKNFYEVTKQKLLMKGDTKDRNQNIVFFDKIYLPNHLPLST